MQKSAVLIIFCLTASTTYGGPYNCTRPSQHCPAGATCNTDGTCQCPPTLEGADCSIVIADKNAPGCEKITCKNGGVCVKKAGGVGCACTVNYYGADCSLKRYQLVCPRNEILFNINPVGTSALSAFIYEKPFPECSSVPVTAAGENGVPESWEGLILRINHNSEKCGKVNPIKAGDKYLFRRTILINYDEDMITAYDDFFKGTCEVKNTVVVVSHQIVVKDEIRTTTPKSGNISPRASWLFLAVCLTSALRHV